jgi:hypothetical protein
MDAASPPLRPFDWIGLIVQALGVVILYFYTRFTARQLKVNQETLAATREALEEARENNKFALEETRKSYGLNRDALILSRRVWLNLGISGEPLAGFTRDAIWISISNIGPIPAAVVHFACTAFLAPTAALDSFPDLTLNRVAPLGAQSTAYHRVPFDMRAPDVRGFPHDRRVLHVVCRVEYEDGFGGTHPMLWAWYLAGETLKEWCHTPGMQHVE